MAQALKVEILGDASSYSRALSKASGDTHTFGKSLASLGKIAAIAGGAAAVGGLFVTLKRGFADLAESQKVAAQTAAVLKSTGDAANTSSDQVEALANSLSSMSGADDEAVQAGENMLLTFTNIRNEAGKNNDIFNQATSTLTDFAFAMNSGAAPSAEQLTKNAILLGKALNDPIRGITALRRVGVSFTESQIKQIKALVDSGHAMEAQKLILRELNKEFGGSAAAAGKTLPGQLNRLKNSFDNLANGIASAFLPAITRALGGLTSLFDKLNQAQGFRAKIKVAASFVWTGLERAVGALRKTLSDLLFGGFSKGGGLGGVGPEGIKFNQGLVSKFTEAFAALDWTTVGQAIIDGISNALRTAGELAKQFATTFANGIRGVDWEAVGRIVGPGLATAITVAFVTLTDPAFWAKNWDLALAVALVAFGGAFGKLAGPIGKLLAKPFGDALLAISGVIERVSPRLAEAFLVSLERLPGAVVRILGDLEGRIAAAFGKLGGLVALTLKIIGADIAIQEVEKFAATVAGFFERLAATIGGAFDSAWAAVKEGALRAALAIVEPFSHLPRILGGGVFQDLKDTINRQLDAIDAKKVTERVRAEAVNIAKAGKLSGEAYAQGWRDALPSVRTAAGQVAATPREVLNAELGSVFAIARNVGLQIGKGMEAGIAAYAQQLIASARATVTNTMAAIADAAGTKSPSTITYRIGQWVAEGLEKGIIGGSRGVVTAVQKYLGKDLTDALVKSLGGTEAKTAAVKGLNSVGNAIVAAAKKYGVDARAALAVATTEGGIKFGAVGDSGHSFGPFQMATFGELAGKTAEQASKFANSIEGINFALRRMAQEGARGQVGLQAITTIIEKFEKPLESLRPGNIQKAFEFYKTLPATVGTALAQTGQVQAKNLGEWLALVKRFTPLIGAEHVKGIISGLVAAQPSLLQQARTQMQAFLAEQRKAIADAKTSFKEAFASLAQSALSSFDAAMAKWKPPSQILLDKMQLEDQINQAVKGVADAQAAVDAAVATRDTLTRNEGESDADFAARQAQAEADIKTAVEALGAAQRSYTETQLALAAAQEQKAHDEKAARDREHLAEDLLRLQTYLAEHPKEYAKVQAKILKLLKTYEGPLFDAAETLGGAFRDGLAAGIAGVVDDLRRLANAIESGKSTAGGGGGGGTPVNPGTAIGGGHGAGRASAVTNNVTVNMPNYLGDARSAAQEIRRELQQLGQNNANNPMAAF